MLTWWSSDAIYLYIFYKQSSAWLNEHQKEKEQKYGKSKIIKGGGGGVALQGFI